MYYNARYYDPQIGQFISPDTIVPDASSVLDYNRFAYVNGNPINGNDPTGHCGPPYYCHGVMPAPFNAAGARVGTIATTAGVGGTANAMGNVVAQAVENTSNDMSIAESLSVENINTTEVGIAFVSGAASGALAPVTSGATALTTNAALGSGQNILTEVYAHGENFKEAILDFDTVLSFGAGALGGAIQGNIPKAVDAIDEIGFGGVPYMRHLGADSSISNNQIFIQHVKSTLASRQVRAVFTGRFLSGGAIGNLSPQCDTLSTCISNIFAPNTEAIEESEIAP